jgi:hypothetical protein
VYSAQFEEFGCRAMQSLASVSDSAGICLEAPTESGLQALELVRMAISVHDNQHKWYWVRGTAVWMQRQPAKEAAIG